jgi:peptidoglycan/xylan/chitin deacetylase (PgdA/CDA1 family)
MFVRRTAACILLVSLLTGCGQPNFREVSTTSIPNSLIAPKEKIVSTTAWTAIEVVPLNMPAKTIPAPAALVKQSSVIDGIYGHKAISVNKAMIMNFWRNQPMIPDPAHHVVLTFDDGPTPYTANLIRYLDKQKAPAVMFWISSSTGFAKPDVLSLLKYSPGITIGDHTATHPNLLRLNEKQQRLEIMSAKWRLEKILGRPVFYFRPPYGNYNETTAKILSEEKLTPVMWGVDTLDWKYQNDTAAILKNVKAELHPGAIILMHDRKNTIKYLPAVIKLLQSKGYSFSTFAKERY